jgi:hypothetical protein
MKIEYLSSAGSLTSWTLVRDSFETHVSCVFLTTWRPCMQEVFEVDNRDLTI